MSSVSLKIGVRTARFYRTTLCPSATVDFDDHKNLSVISKHISLILREIEAFERRLHQIERELAGYETLDPAKLGLPPKLKLVLARHPLPLSRNSRSGITTMVSSVAHSCARPAAFALLSTFMSYRHAASCHTANPLLLSKFISKAYEPLPHRRRPPTSPFPDLPGTPTPRTPFRAMPGWHAGRAVPGIPEPYQPRPGPCYAGLGPRAELSKPDMAPFNGSCLARPCTVATRPCQAWPDSCRAMGGSA